MKSVTAATVRFRRGMKSGDSLSSLPSKLYALVTAGDWDRAIDRVFSHPEEASIWALVEEKGGASLAMSDLASSTLGSVRSSAEEEEEGSAYGCYRLPLHRCLRSKPPVPLVLALLDAFPDSAGCREKYGALPLHVACQAGASLDVVLELLTRYPPAAFERDSFGLLPLHLACAEGAEVRTTEALLCAYPGAAKVKDGSGRLPSDYVRDGAHPTRDALLRDFGRDTNYWFACSTIAAAPGEGKGKGRGRDGSHDRVAVLYNLLMRGEWSEVESRLSSDPSEASIWVMDDADSGSDVSPGTVTMNGCRPCLPIHVACRYCPPIGTVQDLLNAHPSGASARGGRYDLLPLHVACQNGAGVEVVSALLDAYPEGVRMADDFGLLPIRELVSFLILPLLYDRRDATLRNE